MSGRTRFQSAPHVIFLLNKIDIDVPVVNPPTNNLMDGVFKALSALPPMAVDQYTLLVCMLVL